MCGYKYLDRRTSLILLTIIGAKISSDLAASLGRWKKFKTIKKLNQKRELLHAHKSLIRGAKPVDRDLPVDY